MTLTTINGVAQWLFDFCQGRSITYTMPTLGPSVAPWQQQESLLPGKAHHFPKLTVTNKDFSSYSQERHQM